MVHNIILHHSSRAGDRRSRLLCLLDAVYVKKNIASYTDCSLLHYSDVLKSLLLLYPIFSHLRCNGILSFLFYVSLSSTELLVCVTHLEIHIAEAPSGEALVAGEMLPRGRRPGEAKDQGWRYLLNISLVSPALPEEH